jgi:hypothetical protein
MNRDDLDRWLKEDALVPSSGFAGRVMDAVHHEMFAPRAIPFPWTRALPGLVALAIALASVIVIGGPWISTAAPLTPAAALRVVASQAVQWSALAVLLTVASVLFSLRLMRVRGGRL